jgi:hypothetical protein
LVPIVNGKRPDGFRPDEDDHDPDYQLARGSFGFRTGRRSGLPYDGPAVVGPLGIIPLHEDSLPSVLFNFWMGHTNFDITTGPTGVKEKIEAVAGVETLDVFTRYRFRLGIGRAFDEKVVLSAVDAAVVAPPPDAQLVAIRTMLAARYPFWAVARTPNNLFRSAGGNSPDEVFRKLGPVLGSELHTSWEKPDGYDQAPRDK